MQQSPVPVLCLALLLAGCLLAAGCESPGPASQTPQATGVSATIASGAAAYTAGDVVRNPSATADVAWLVLGYDAGTGMYERALIYPNSDGTWGYRTDTRTETVSRSVMEKVYTEKLATVPVSSVPVITPTTPAVTTRPVTVAVTTVATTQAPQNPVIKKIIPDHGYAGTTVTISDLVGDNFAYGATVALSRSGSTTITATDVRVVSNKSIICKFVIPPQTTGGSYDVTVTNTDGKTTTFTNIFNIIHDVSMMETTQATSAGTIPITAIAPSALHVGYYPVDVTGSGFQPSCSCKLTKSGSGDIVATSVVWNSATSVRCFFMMPVGSFGTWDFVLTNGDSSYGQVFNAVTIN